MMLLASLFLSMPLLGSETTITCLTDRLERSPGVTVMVEDSDGDPVVTALTGENGSTPVVDVPYAESCTVYLGETVSRSGTLLGTTYQITTPPQWDTDQHIYDLLLTQPRAEPVVVEAADSGPTSITPTGTLNWWNLSLWEGSRIRFATKVAYLPNRREIRGALRYLGYEGSTSEYEHGVFLDMPAVDLTGEGLSVTIRHREDAFSSQPVVDAIHLSDPPSGNEPTEPPVSVPQDPPTVEVWYWDSTRSEAWVRVQGGMPEGRLFLLLRPDDGTEGEVTFDHALYPDLGSAQQAVQATACEPLQPDGSVFSCSPPTPSPKDDCSVTKLVGPDLCEVDTRKIGRTRCGSPSETLTATTVCEVFFSATIHGGFDAKFIDAGFEVQGGWKAANISTSEYEFQPGDFGVGTCIQRWVHGVSCTADFERRYDLVYADYPVPIVQPCAGTEIVSTVCHRSVTDSTVCSKH